MPDFDRRMTSFGARRPFGCFPLCAANSPVLLALLLASVLALPIAVEAQVRLPACPGQLPVAAWTNCGGTYTFPNRGTYVGEFKDGKRSGQGAMTFPNGENYDGAYRDGMRNGQGVLALPNGEKYAGGFRNGKYDGQGKLTFADGASYDGDFRAGQPDGFGTLTFADGSRYVGEVRNGRRNGQGTEYGADGKVLQSGIWENNLFVTRQ